MTHLEVQNIIEFKGNLTFPKIEDILHDAKLKLQELGIDSVIQKRLYSILVESLENALKHKVSCTEHELTQRKCVEMNLSVSNDLLILHIGNYIPNKNLESLLHKIEALNTLNLESLNNLYRTSIANARISDKGGAGLGMIEIARNSRQIIKYHSIKENSEISFFIFEISISKHLNKN